MPNTKPETMTVDEEESKIVLPAPPRRKKRRKKRSRKTGKQVPATLLGPGDPEKAGAKQGLVLLENCPDAQEEGTEPVLSLSLVEEEEGENLSGAEEKPESAAPTAEEEEGESPSPTAEEEGGPDLVQDGWDDVTEPIESPQQEAGPEPEKAEEDPVEAVPVATGPGPGGSRQDQTEGLEGTEQAGRTDRPENTEP